MNEVTYESRTSYIESNWDNSHHPSPGVGWKEPGNWTPGKYRVDLFLNGKKLTSGSFEILSTPTTLESLNPAKKYIKFFEQGKGGYLPLDKRQYSDRFAQASARYIHWELDLEHPAPGARIDYTIEAVLYNPGGSISPRQSEKQYIDGQWVTSTHAGSGWGWETPGHWNPGKYRVDLFLNGKKLISGSFEIY